MLFIGVNIYSFYVADQDTARYSFSSAQDKCESLSEPYSTDSLLSSHVFLLSGPG